MPTDENRRLNRETLRLAARYSELDMLLDSMLAYLPDNAKRLGVSGEQVTNLTAQQKAWAADYQTYLDPNTRTRAVIMQMDTAYKTTIGMTRTVQQQIKNDANVTLIGDDYTAMGIHKDKETRTRVPVQTVAPHVESYEIRHLENKFRTSYPDSAGDFHRRLPAYNSLIIKVAYTAADAPAPTNEEDYNHVTMSGRSQFTVVSPPNTPAGTRGYVKVCYVNSRGETGPDSAPLMFLVN